jgi:hypothetical protein
LGDVIATKLARHCEVKRDQCQQREQRSKQHRDALTFWGREPGPLQAFSVSIT